ncbi:hypothetical protein SB4_09930 [Sphingomonas sanguinis]|uniref:Uncharacterized protein n=2 Tax=Sphingomonas sanguinis TaxID=33051 RepID=A0A147ITQ7_9SPHN|nr:hypothetical protein SB4_09930 [Sphingomonas sanguinis]
MLLRAFRMNATGKVARVRVFRADRSYTSPVEDVAAERFFYSDLAQGGADTLDDVITRYENGLASDLAELNATSGSASPQTAARVVTHLLVRNDHVRGIMQAGASAMAGLVGDLFGSEEKVAALLGAADKTPGPQFRKVFEEHIADNPIISAMGVPPAAFIPIAHAMLRENASASYGEMSGAIEEVVSRFQAHGPLEARDAHARALSASLAPQGRVEMLEQFTWRVDDIDGNRLILPDFVALGWNNDGVAGSLLEHGKDELAVVMMPLSPRRALIGSLGEVTADTFNFNEAAIPHCLSFFVGSEVSPALEFAATKMGFGAAALLRQSLEQSAASFRATVAQAPPARTEQPADWASEPLGRVELHTDCVDQEGGRRLNVVIGQILGLAKSRFDISTLRRIIINSDYDGALSSLVRGRFDTIEAPPVPSAAGLSIAYNVNIEQDGVDGVAIVLRGGVAAGLLGEDDLSFGWAASVVLGQLARLGATALINKVFDGGVTEGDQIDALLFRYSLPGWKAWLVSGYAGLLDPELKNIHRDRLRDRLATITDDLVGIRRAYRIHGDVDRLIHDAGEAVSDLFELACAVTSHSGDDHDLALEGMLSERGLTNWFDLLRSDLPSIWRDGTKYPAQVEMLVLNQHIRRLLLLGAIFFWDDDGRGRVEVPHWSDFDWMLAHSQLPADSADAADAATM